MRRLLLPLLLVTTTAFAQPHSRAVTPNRPDISGETVSGTVSAVNGSLVSLAGGLVTIDIANATVTGNVVPGALLFAALKPGTFAANAPLPAAYVTAVSTAQVTLSGTVTAVDLTANTLTLLGRTIKTNAQTTFSGLMTFRAMTLADVFPGQTALVDANVSGGALVASSVRVTSVLAPPALTVVRGTVKSIGNDAWVITVNGKDTTINVNASTKIINDPKAGDTVDVLIVNNVALSIMKVPTHR